MRYTLLLVFAACGRIGFGLDVQANGDGGHDATSVGDAIVGIGDGMFAGCIAPGNSDMFDNVVPCSPWGAAIMMNAALSESGGTLSASPSPSTASARGGCSHTAVPLTAAGMLLEIEQPASGANTYLVISGGGTSYQLMAAGTEIFPIQSGDMMIPLIPYDPVAMRFWRLRPNPSNLVEYETSPDGGTWTSMRTSTKPAPANVTIEFGAVETQSTPTPGTAVFASVNTCP